MPTQHAQRSSSASRPKGPPSHRSRPASCRNCGKDAHPRSQCPARDAACFKCGKSGHFGAVCRSKLKTGANVGTLADDAFLGAIDSDAPWMQRIYIGHTPVSMKVDTGADVTAIPEDVFKTTLQSTPALRPAKKILRGTEGRPLNVIKSFSSSFSRTLAFDQSSQHTIYAVRGLSLPLLGRPAIASLHVLHDLCEVEQQQQCYAASYITDAFPKLFTGIGELKGIPYTIRLDQNATPSSLAAPRRVPIPLQLAVDDEPQRLVAHDIIKKVDDSTEWCADSWSFPSLTVEFASVLTSHR